MNKRTIKTTVIFRGKFYAFNPKVNSYRKNYNEYYCT